MQDVQQAHFPDEVQRVLAHEPCKARSTIRLTTRRCVRCFRSNPTTPNQLMGNLPVSRVVPSPPFAVTGVDYAGPFWTKQGTRRLILVKSYVAVDVCMATKAVHLEGVTDLSTNASIARRGMFHEIDSDNATLDNIFVVLITIWNDLL